MLALLGLELFAHGFEDDVADEGAEEGYGEVGWGDDVREGVGEGAGVGGAGELAHEEVGVEEEDDEGHLDGGAGEGEQEAVAPGDERHEGMIEDWAGLRGFDEGGGLGRLCYGLRHLLS